MNPAPKISVIIPIHNSCNYIEKCILSLLNQSLKEIEIIAVLDCPTDGTDRIVESLAHKDERIKLIANRSNLHIGLCRNIGIRHATGKYIGFCDHDDYCDPDMYARLYEKAEEENLDIAFSNYLILHQDHKISKYIYPQVRPIERLRTERIEGMIRRRNYASGVIWNHIFKTQFIKKHNLLFTDTHKISAEDCLFYLMSYYHAKKINGIQDFLYIHRMHDNNTGKSDQYQSLNKIIAFLEMVNTFLKENGLEHKYNNYLYEGTIRHLYTLFRRNIKHKSLKKIAREFKNIQDNSLVKSTLNYYYTIGNIKKLFELKPSIICFLAFMKLI